jgi:hypothetical protein
MNLKQINSAGVPLYGNPDWRGKCPLEAAEAVSFFCQLRAEFPELAKVATHIRNEGKRTKRQGYQHQQEGMNTGASDVIIPVCPPIVMEMKRRDHTLSSISKDQVEYLVASHELGAFHGVALGASGAMEMVRAWVAKHGR